MTTKTKRAPKIPEAPSPLADVQVLTESRPSRQEKVDLGDLTFPSDNPREPVKPDQVRGLAATMARFGMLQPVVVLEGEDGTHVLLAGHRRVAAAKLLGWKAVPAHVLTRTAGSAETLEHLAAAVALVENQQREGLDPLRDCAVVEQLLAEEGATPETVAAELGRSASWVVRRAKLRELTPAVRKLAAAGGPIAAWPAAWLEDLALLPADDQLGVAKLQADGRGRLSSREELRALVRSRLRRLGAAPWKLSDAELVAKAGACSACPHHTGARPGLFEEPSAHALEDATCLRPSCFDGKLVAWRAGAVARARELHGDKLLLLEGRGFAKRGGVAPEVWEAEQRARDFEFDLDREVGEKPKPEAGAPVLSDWAVQPAKKGAPGAVPALVVSGAGVGQTRWVRPNAKPKGSGTPKAAKPTKAERLEALRGRRRAHVVAAVRGLLEVWLTKPNEEVSALLDDDRLLDLVSVWGCEGVVDSVSERVKLAQGKDLAKRNGRVLRGLVEAWGHTLNRGTSSEAKLEAHADAVAIMRATGQLALLGELEAAAVLDLPTPAGWDDPKRQAGPAKLPTKRKGKPTGKDAASGEREEG